MRLGMRKQNLKLSNMELKPITIEDYEFLYEMLKEREPNQSISFSMPTWENHVKFLDNKPYPHFYIIMENGEKVGNIYLTDHDEWGYFILKKHVGRGLGTKAFIELVKKHPKDYYYANINPDNEAAIHQAFDKFAGRLIQYTYKIDGENLKKFY